VTEADADAAIALALEFEAKPTLDEMIQQVDADLWQVQGSQRARLIADMMERPMPDQVRRVAVYTALHSLLQLIKQRPAEVARQLQKRGANAQA
jgi:hypothetical protein